MFVPGVHRVLRYPPDTMLPYLAASRPCGPAWRGKICDARQDHQFDEALVHAGNYSSPATVNARLPAMLAGSRMAANAAPVIFHMLERRLHCDSARAEQSQPDMAIVPGRPEVPRSARWLLDVQLHSH